MNDDFEDLLRRWLRDRAGNDKSALRALAGNVAALPPRRPNRVRPLAVAASILVVLGLIAFVMPRTGDVGSEANPSTRATPASSPGATGAAIDPTSLPGGPILVGIPWLEACGGLNDMLTAFVVPRARDLPLYLPAMLRAPEIERDEPAFVLIYKGRHPSFLRRLPPPEGGTPGPDPTLAPNHHDMCVIVGPITGAGSKGYYGDVSIEGFNPNPAGAAPSPPPTTAAPPFPVWPGIAWSDTSGDAVDPLILAAFAGPASCEWDRSAFLEIGWPLGSQALEIDNVRRYVRDPDGIFGEGFVLLDRLDLSADLPSDAAFAGYRSGEIELWSSPATIDKAIYLRWPDHVERWPRMENVAGCN